MRTWDLSIPQVYSPWTDLGKRGATAAAREFSRGVNGPFASDAPWLAP